MKRGFLKTVLMVTLSTVFLASCSGGASKSDDSKANGESKQSESSKEADTGENVTLKLYANYSDDQEKDTLDRAIEEMKKEMPNVMVEIEPASQDDGQKLKTYAASGNLPDIFKSDGVDIETFNKSNTLVELDEYAKEAGIIDDIADAYKDALYMSDGHIYAVPWQSPWVNSFYANKKVFEENGVKIPQNYDEFLTAVKTFNEKGVLPYALFGKEKQWCLHLYDIMVTRKAPDGIKGLDENTAKAGDADYLEAANKLIELVNAGMLSKDVFNTTYDQAKALFTSDKCAMFMTGTWALNGLEQEMGDNLVLMYYPLAAAGSEEEARWNMSGGYSQGGFSVPEYSKNKEIAAKYAVLLSRKVNDAFVALEGGTSIYKDSPKSEKELGPVMSQYIEDTKNFKSMSKFDWNLSNQELKTVMEDKAQELLTGTITAEDFAKEIDAAIEETN